MKNIFYTIAWKTALGKDLKKAEIENMNLGHFNNQEGFHELLSTKKWIVWTIWKLFCRDKLFHRTKNFSLADFEWKQKNQQKYQISSPLVSPRATIVGQMKQFLREKKFPNCPKNSFFVIKSWWNKFLMAKISQIQIFNFGNFLIVFFSRASPCVKNNFFKFFKYDI